MSTGIALYFADGQTYYLGFILIALAMLCYLVEGKGIHFAGQRGSAVRHRLGLPILDPRATLVLRTGNRLTTGLGCCPRSYRRNPPSPAQLLLRLLSWPSACSE